MRDIRNAELVLIKNQEEFDLIKQRLLIESVFEATFTGFGYYAKLQYTRRDVSCNCGNCYNYVDEYLPLNDYIKELEAEKAKLQELIDEANQKM